MLESLSKQSLIKTLSEIFFYLFFIFLYKPAPLFFLFLSNSDPTIYKFTEVNNITLTDKKIGEGANLNLINIAH